MSKLIQIIHYEEGYREKPYIDSEGYPTVGYGIRIGPKDAGLSHYTFTLPKSVGELWTEEFIQKIRLGMARETLIASALLKCNAPRKDILCSMAYQMGISGLCNFRKTLAMITGGDFTGAAYGMRDSLWNLQTPARAFRHSEVMRTGTYGCYEGLI